MAAQTVKTMVSSKGQVILPIAIRTQLQWGAGTRLLVETTPEGVLLTAAPAFAPSQPASVYGALPAPSAPRTVADMKAGVAAEARRRHARG